MKQLKSTNDSVRRAAASALWQVNKESLTDAVPIIKEALRDKDEFVLRIAVSILGNVNQNAASEVIPALKTALEDPNVFVRSFAASSLGDIGQGNASEAVLALNGALQDKNLFVRFSAANALGQIGPAAANAVGSLRTAAQDTEWLVRVAAVRASGKIGSGPAADKAIPLLKEALRDKDLLVRLAAAEALGQIGALAENAVADLKKAVQDSEGLVRRAAITALGRIAQGGVDEARLAIEEALQSPRADIRLYAVDTIWRTGVPLKSAVPPLLQLLRDVQAETRRAAAGALGRVRPAISEIVDALKVALTDKDASVREASASALGNLGNTAKDAVPNLRQALKDSNREVRRAAAIAVGNVRVTDSETVAALRAALEDKDESVRQAAVWALVTLGTPPPDAIPTLQRMIQDPAREIRRGAAVALGRMGPAAKDAVPNLTMRLKDPNEQVRLDTVNALGNIGTAAGQAVPTLSQIVMDEREKPNIRQAVAEALGKIGPSAKDALPSLKTAMRSENEQVRFASARAFAGIGPPSEILPALTDDLKSADVTVRRTALQGLSTMGSAAKDAVPALIESLKAEDENVRHGAANALKNMGLYARDAVPALTEALQGPNPNGSAAEALFRIAVAAQDQGATELIPRLEKAFEKLSTMSSFKEQTETVRRAIDDLKRRQLIDFIRALVNWIQRHPILTTLIVFYPLLAIGWLFILWIRPLWILRLNYALQPYKDFSLPPSLGGMKVPLRHLLLVGFIHHSTPVLDAWVRKYISAARAEFVRKDTVRDRSVHISLPVIFNGTSTASLSVESLRATFDTGKACLLICGEGGTGKTSLACQIAKWAMSAEREARLCHHLILPVLIEEELGSDSGTNKNPLITAIRGQLRSLLQLADPISEDLLLELLKRKRVLVIVDHMSEMVETTRKYIRPGQAEFAANALIVTSRVEEKLDGVPKTIVRPLLVRGNRLASFMEAYLTSRGKRFQFDDDEFFAACRKLTSIVGKRNITVLLAKLYADQIIAVKDGILESDLPNNIPDLMFYYLNNINRIRGDTDPADQTVQSVAKIIAWECLKDRYRPVSAKRDVILGALSAEAEPEQLLGYLEKRLRLINTIGVERDQVRFSLDPLAEYLAGLHLVSIYGDDRQLWDLFLVKADQSLNTEESVQEFLSAVRDCCEAKCTDARIRSYILTELERRLSSQNANP